MKVTDFGVAVVDGDSHLSAWVVEQRRLNVQEEYCRTFEKYIPVGGVVVDVGACIGDHTLSYANMVGPRGAVYAFEPNRTAYECLRFNMRHVAGVTSLRCALGSSRGRGFIRASGEQPGNLGAAQFVAGAGDTIMEPLDLFALQRLDFLKIDAEGYEPDILIGAMATIARCRPVMVIEINAPLLLARGTIPATIAEFLKANRYTVESADPAVSMSEPSIDILAVPE